MKRLSCLLLVLASLHRAQAASIELDLEQAIPDGDWNGLASTLYLTGLSSPVTSFEVNLNITGTYTGDLYAYLTHGDAIVPLLNRPGRTATDSLGYADQGLQLYFADGAADVHTYRRTLFGNDSTSLSGPLTGTWGPDGRAVSPAAVTDETPRTSFLSSLLGQDPNGAWTLYVADVNGGDVHKLNSWGMNYETSTPVRVPDTTNTGALLLLATAALGLLACRKRARSLIVALLFASLTVAWATESGKVAGWGTPSFYPVEGYGARFTQIAAGRDLSVALKDNGTVVTMGMWYDETLNHAEGQPAWLRDVVAVTAADTYAVALRKDGTVVSWGFAFDGEIYFPYQPEGLSNVIAISAKDHHLLALKNDGTVESHGDYCAVCDLKPNGGVPPGLSGVVAVSAGTAFDLALHTDGHVSCWTRYSNTQCSVPSDLGPVAAIAAGGAHGLALKHDGTVVAWGSNSDGQCNVPAALANVIAISAGQSHSLALKADGTVVAWGSNAHGQSQVPAGLTDVGGISAGSSHSLAVKHDGSVVRWGLNLFGQCNDPNGLDDVTAVSLAYRYALALKADGSVVELSSGAMPAGLNQVTAIAAGGRWNGGFGLALKQDGTVTAWGDNDQGQATVPAGLNHVTGIAAGGDHSLAVKDDGTVVAWGANAHGQCNVPASAAGAIAVAAGSRVPPYYERLPSPLPGFSLALKSDGTVVAWGDNSAGQCSVPAGLNNVKAISAGYQNSLALKKDGTVVEWGKGPGDVPPGLDHVIAISAGLFHSLALKDDGTIVAFPPQSIIPTGALGVFAIAAGGEASLALFHDVNRAPNAPTWRLQTFRDTPNSIQLKKLVHAITDPEGDSFAVTQVSPGDWGRNAVLTPDSVFYMPPTGFTGEDAVTYTVVDARGAQAQGRIYITVDALSSNGLNILQVAISEQGIAIVRCAGIPGFTYLLEASSNLLDWVRVDAGVAGVNGLFELTDPDASQFSTRYYRTRTSSPPP